MNLYNVPTQHFHCGLLEKWGKIRSLKVKARSPKEAKSKVNAIKDSIVVGKPTRVPIPEML